MKFDRDELLTIISNNRDAHRRIFEEAIEGYRKEAVAQLEAHVERIKRGELILVSVHLPRPEDHTREYDRLLKMLQMTKEQSIELSETQFQAYVLDDWNWKRQFLTSNRMYSPTALLSLQEMDD